MESFRAEDYLVEKFPFLERKLRIELLNME